MLNKTFLIVIVSVLLVFSNFDFKKFHNFPVSGRFNPELSFNPEPLRFGDNNGSEKKAGTSQSLETDTEWKEIVQKNIEKEEYNITFNEQTKTYSSPNRKNNITFLYGKDGFTAKTMQTKIPASEINDAAIQDEKRKYEIIPEWSVSVKLTEIVSGEAKNTSETGTGILLEDSEIKTINNTAFIEDDNLRINYTNNEEGMRQDFIIKKKPEGKGKLILNFAADTKLKMITGADALIFKDNEGSEKMKYSALKVWDANGRELRAYFERNEKLRNKSYEPRNKSKIQNQKSEIEKNSRFCILVNDEDAVYPVTVDPVSTSPSWVVSFGYSFGSASSPAGDVNGDGYGDVIVGAKETTTNFTNDGKVYLFLGSATGLSVTPAWTGIGANQGSAYGHSLAAAGDVNGDGYSDIIIGEPGYKDSAINRGRALVYFGSQSGLSAAPGWTAVGSTTDFGRAVSTAGDVNGDGFSDVIVSTAYGTVNSAVILGGAYLYLGSASGLSSNPVWQANGSQYFENYGNSICTAGDINGDGYSDVVIGAPEYSLSSSSKEGAVYAYYGSAAGLSDTSNWLVTGQSQGYKLGFSVYTAGDVNGDGYSDVIAGAPDSNKAFVYFGSASGLSVNPDWSATSSSNTGFGYSVSAAGDNNGDGFSDVIIGAPGGTGQAFVYNGSASGLSSNSVWSVSSDGSTGSLGFSVRTAGDVNGDGYSDVLVCGYSPKAYVYNGSPAGFLTVNNWSYNGGSGAFGWTVAGAGDVNGDGYSDVIIGAPDYFSGSIAVGRFYIFHGSASGLPSTPSFMKTGTSAGSTFYRVGKCVASAGDVNGDGYSDIAVGVTNGVFASYVNFGIEVYYGSSSGINSTPSWTKSSAVNGDEFGTSVASAGDVNGDGYSDIIAGAYKINSESGAAYVFYGSASGLPANANWSATGISGSWFGFSAAGAGDVNGDGYGDIIIGAPKQSSYGAAYVYHGSGTGISASPSWQFTASLFPAQSWYGASVACAGDVNGDGFSDVLIGASKLYLYTNIYAGAAFGYYGSPGGLPASWNWSVNAPDPYFAHEFGACVASAGDVNGDGYSDAIISAPYPFGHVYCYYGSGSGLPYTHNEVLPFQSGLRFGYSAASAGDVNGDGYSDIIVGAYFSSGGTSYIFNGNTSKGNSSFVQQSNPSTNIITGPGGLTTTSGQIKLGIFLKSPYGRAGGKVVYEYKPNGTAFTPLTNTAGSGSGGSYQNAGFGGSLLNATVSGFQPDRSYKWRARVQYNPVNNPYQKLGPWRFYNAQTPLPFEGFRSICPACSSTINITVIPEGFYNAGINQLYAGDTARAYLHSISSPYNIADSAIAFIDPVNLTGSFVFSNAASGIYYIEIRHRNSIETWSKTGGEVFTSGTAMNYNFSNSSSQAFGSNMIQVNNSPVRFGIFSGDVNQDGTIDAGDLSQVENDAAKSESGYVQSDVNGDDYVDAADLSIVENNATTGVNAVTP
ncbi:MAG: FG-GAP repeat protein [Ignavibacteria bacterium]|nr:FG-GAP repeat protein [Ignavibacteria bacterium]